MTKLILKTALTITLCTSAFLAKAQLGYDYAQYDVGVGLGLNYPISTDVTKALKYTPSAQFNFNYNHGPFVNYVFEGQFGSLKAGDVNQGYGRTFENHFWAFALRVQLQAGELMDYSKSPMANAFKGFYLSTGIGYLVNHVKRGGENGLPAGVQPAGDNNSQIPFIPLRIGYEIKLFNQYNDPGIKIDLGYQYNRVMDDNLDGYKAGRHNDIFTQFILGIKVGIGGVTSYRKQIYY
ncbi:hypothetical protein [Mucilaginibacter sp. RCC_168]|jgi:hypothetical protein|uniref:hypothetical protein n=1 Tax=unclassified Mucilaginibacter TaxID=2617802 RepID=UPI0035256A0B